MANCIIDGKTYGRELAHMWIAGYRAAERERGIVECAECAHLSGEFCTLLEFGSPGMAEDGFCKWGDPVADSSKDFSNWSLNDGRKE